MGLNRDLKTLTPERLRELLTYDPFTGVFADKAGAPVGYPHAKGYVYVSFGGWQAYAHRLAWFYMTGRWPVEVDHENRNKADNKWRNLRSATHSENLANAKIAVNNTSGVRGVYWCKRTAKWHARISVNRRSVSLKYFDSLEEAAVVRKAAAAKYFGKFATAET